MKKLLVISLALGVAGASSAQVLYSTGFEAPTFTLGGDGLVDGWTLGSNFGTTRSIVNSPAIGGQSLSLSTTSTGFGSNRLAFDISTQTLPVFFTTQVLLQSGNEANRLGTLALSTGTLGGTFFGASVDSAGNFRAGQNWGSTYGATTLGTFTNSVADRWVQLTLSVATNGDGVATATLGSESFSANFSGIAKVGFVNLASDYAGASGLGNVYFDDFSVEAIPEPMTMAVLGLGALGLAARKRRRA